MLDLNKTELHYFKRLMPVTNGTGYAMFLIIYNIT